MTAHHPGARDLDESGLAGVTDLEAALQGPDGPSVRAALAARFAELRRQVAADIAAGLPPQEFCTAQAVTEALNAATEVVTAVKVSALKR